MAHLPTSCLIKIPRQARSMQLVHDLLDAGIVVLEREGAEGFTTNRVAEVAGVSVGSLYQYFSNKEMILSGIVERGVLDAEDLIHQTIQTGATSSPEEMLRQTANLLLTTFAPYRNILHEILAATPLLSRSGIMAVLETRLSDAVRNYLLANDEHYRIRGGAAGLYAAVNAAIYVGLKWLAEGPRHVQREQLVHALVASTAALFYREETSDCLLATEQGAPDRSGLA